jgi:hypothetical protein
MSKHGQYEASHLISLYMQHGHSINMSARVINTHPRQPFTCLSQSFSQGAALHSRKPGFQPLSTLQTWRYRGQSRPRPKHQHSAAQLHHPTPNRLTPPPPTTHRSSASACTHTTTHAAYHPPITHSYPRHSAQSWRPTRAIHPSHRQTAS